eukprot:SAG11_NODE_381_length_9941_cov_11.761885_5_plen_95_part_00
MALRSRVQGAAETDDSCGIGQAGHTACICKREHFKHRNACKQASKQSTESAAWHALLRQRDSAAHPKSRTHPVLETPRRSDSWYFDLFVATTAA